MDSPLLRPRPQGLHRKLLYNIDEIPKWQRDNDFILTGYVHETYSFAKCFQSLLYINNEWVNVITHLIPGSVLPLILGMLVPFVAATNTNFIKSIPSSIIAIPTFEDSNSIDTIVFGLFFFGFIACLSCSAMFHTIKVHSYKVASVGNNLDYAGIVVLITTSMVGIIHYSYSDLALARYIFLALTTIFGTACMITTWSPKFKTVAWRPFRAGMFITFGLSALLPIGYGLIRFGSEEAIKRSGFWFVLLEGIGYISGALLYASRIPERFSPGSFDLFGQSHQIFHVLVVLSAFSHFKALVQSYIYAHVRSAL